MITRSPSKLTLLLLLTLFLAVVVWHRSPWSHAQIYVYQRLPFITPKQNPLPNPNPNEAQKPLDLSRPGHIPAGIPDGPNVNGGRPDFKNPGWMKQNKTTKPPPWETMKESGNRLDYESVHPQDMKAYMREMLDWNRPDYSDHWPPFDDYLDQGYDPNRWEEFE